MQGQDANLLVRTGTQWTTFPNCEQGTCYTIFEYSHKLFSFPVHQPMLFYGPLPIFSPSTSLLLFKLFRVILGTSTLEVVLGPTNPTLSFSILERGMVKLCRRPGLPTILSWFVNQAWTCEISTLNIVLAQCQF